VEEFLTAIVEDSGTAISFRPWRMFGINLNLNANLNANVDANVDGPWLL
jgi:hypothetical protein